MDVITHPCHNLNCVNLDLNFTSVISWKSNVSQQWFRRWLGICLNQCWRRQLTQCSVTMPQWVESLLRNNHKPIRLHSMKFYIANTLRIDVVQSVMINMHNSCCVLTYRHSCTSYIKLSKFICYYHYCYYCHYYYHYCYDIMMIFPNVFLYQLFTS